MDDEAHRKSARRSVLIAAVAVVIALLTLFVAAVMVLQYWDSIYGA